MALPIFAVVGGILLTGRRLLRAMHGAAERLSEEHHALRSIATAVASGESPEAVCSLAAEQAAVLLGADGAGILRFDPDDHVVAVGTWQRVGERPPPGSRYLIVGSSPIATIRREGRPVRIDDSHAPGGHCSETLERNGFQCLVGTPIRVRGRLWGAVAVTALGVNGLPPEAEAHLSEFAELIGMAVANTEEVARLNADATTDPLTGLSNHRAFQERLHAEVGRAQRHERSVAVALVDVDRFKTINDAGGHALGDQVLCAVAAHLREHLRGEDVLARVGGDEFAVLLPEATAEDAAFALERARRAIEGAPFAGGAHVTISVGVCHDVGKIGVPDAILLKPARLTPEEYEVIKGHAELGSRMVEEILSPEQVDWILSHHERPDGGGYPRGLLGDALTEGAGLLAAADAFDVMASARPSSPGRSIDEALAECHALLGRQITPAAVAALDAVYGAVSAAA